MIKEIKVLLENKITEGDGSLSLSPQEVSDPLFRKALYAAGTGDGWYLQLSGAGLKAGAKQKAGMTGFTFTAETVSMGRKGQSSAPVPFEGFAMTLLASENEMSGECRYILRFSRKKDEAGSALKNLFPNLAKSRVIDGGAMVLVPSLIGDISMEEECYFYDTDFSDLEKESEEDTYPQPLYVSGYLNLKDSTLKEEYPFLPDRLKLEGDGEGSACMLRFFDRANPAFRFYAGIEETPFSFADILLHLNGFGLFLTNTASDEYATLEDYGIVSQALLYIDAKLCAASQSIALFLYSDLFQNSGYWNFSAQFPDGVSINQGLGFLFGFLQDADSVESYGLPQDVWALSHLLLREVHIAALAADRDSFADSAVPGLSVAKIKFLVQSDAPWETPVPLLSFDNVGIALEAVSDGKTFRWHGNLFADFVFQGKSSQNNGISFRTILSLPELSIRAWLLDEVRLPLSEALSGFLGMQISGLPQELWLTDARINGSYQNKSVGFSLTLGGEWGFSIGNNRFALTELSGEAALSPGDYWVSVSGLVEIQVQNRQQPAVLSLGVSYNASSKAWLFTGGLNRGALELVDFVANFFGTPPKWVETYAPDITIRDFDFSYSTESGNPMAVSGVLDAAVPLSFFGTSFQMQIMANAKRSPANGTNNGFTGGVKGVVRIGKFALLAEAQFVHGEQKPSYAFEFWINGAFLRAAVIRKGGKELLKISLHNMKVGEVIEFFGRLVNPNYDFKLDPPWDVLESISLSGTELTIDLLDKVLTFIYPLNRNIGIARIGNLGFQYGWGQRQKGFDIILTGDFLGEKYTEAHPLSWDVMNETPPGETPDGKKFDLSFLAFGEHVTYDGYRQNQVSEALAAMKKAMTALDNESSDPFSNRKVRFDAATGIVLGLEARIAGFISLQAVFKQPDLYGGLLTLSGNGAGSLSGLSVELLYTVKDQVGCFSVTFTAPYRFRRLSFGAVTLELGRIVIQIYTNGGFMVDLGFPHNMNFQHSFGLEVFPFKGKGGAYFGVLHGNGYHTLPATNQGVFSPVIAFGLGVDIGVGKSLNAGILSASVSASVVGMLEGVLAWFHPYRRDSSDLYYHVSGSVVVKGSLWGKVDFFVVAVTVGVNLSAGLMLTLRSAEPTALVLWVDVEAYASIRIIFITISFSFHINLSVDFTFGKSQAAPWKNTFAPDCHGRARGLYGIRNKNAAQRMAVFTSKNREAGRLDYESALLHMAAVADTEKQPINVWLTPYFSVKDIDVQVAQDTQEEPSRCVCIFLSMPDETGEGESLTALIKAFLHLNLDAAGISVYQDSGENEDTVIRRDSLKHLEELLADPETAYGQLTVDNIVRTMQGFGISFLISYPKDDADEANPVNGTAFPMPPVLTGIWRETVSGMEEERNYADYGYVDEEYVAWLRKLYGSFYESFRQSRETGDTSGSSMAEHTFRGYFYMLSRITVQKALAIMENLPCEVQSGQTLRGLCESYPQVEAEWLCRERESVDEIARYFGMTDKEMVFLNPSLPEELPSWKPGETHTLKLGLTPQAVLSKNPDWALTDKTPLHFPVLPCVIAGQDTIRKMTDRVNGNLSDTIEKNLDTEGILLPGREFTLPDVTVDLPHSMLLDLWAAVFYVRIFQPELPEAEWYYEAIMSLNKEEISEYLIIPAAYGRMKEGSRLKWKLLAGDTPRLVASYCALYQNGEPGEEFPAFLGRVRQANQEAGENRFILPRETKITVLSGETLRTMAVRLFLRDGSDMAKLCDAAAAFADISILDAGQTLYIADAKLETAGETAEEFADRWRVPFDDFAELIQEEAVLSAGEITLPALYGLSLTELSGRLCNTQNLADISGLLSHFLWNGQVVPEKFENGQYVNLMGLYEKTGQQFEVRTADSQSDLDTAYMFSLKKNGTDSWVTLSGETVDVAVTNDMISQYCPAKTLSHIYLERKPFDVVEQYLPEFLFCEMEDWEQILEEEERTDETQNESSRPYIIAYFPEGFCLYDRKAAVRKRRVEEEERNGAESGTDISGVCFATAVSVVMTALSDTLYAVCPADETALKQIRSYQKCGKETEIHLLFEDVNESGKWISDKDHRETALLFDLNGTYSSFDNSLDFAELLSKYGLSDQMLYLHMEMNTKWQVLEKRKCLLLFVLPKQEETVTLACNCAVLPGYLDRARESIYAIEKDGDVSAVDMFPVEAGTAGYRLIVAKPEDQTSENDGETEQELQARRIYSMASFHIEEEPFSDLNLLLPMFPQTMEGDADFEGVSYGKNEAWRYLIKLKLAEAVAEEMPDGSLAAAVPPALRDPYRAVAYARENSWTSPYQLTVEDIWHDLAGNRSEPEPALGIEFGYSDGLKPLLSYEGTTGAYRIEKSSSDKKAALYTTIHFDCGDYMPDGKGILSQDEIEEAIWNIEQAYYQVAQDDVSLSLACSLLDGKAEIPVQDLRDYASSAWAYLKLLQAGNDVVSESRQTLNDICDTYGVTLEGLAAANEDAALETLFGTAEYSVPEMNAWEKGDTLQSLCGETESVYACAYNVSLPLRTGVTIMTASRSVTCPETDEAVSLSWIADKLGIPARDLARANSDLNGIWKEKVTFEYNGYSIPADVNDSLSDVAEKFQEKGVLVTAVELAMEYQDAFIWKPGLTLSADVLVVEEGMTLTSAADQLGTKAASLAKLNLSTADLFADGTLLLTAASSAYEQTLTLDDMTLKEVSALLGIKPQVLLYVNREKTGLRFRIPGHVDILWEEENKSWFSVDAASFESLADAHGVQAQSLFYANQAVTEIVKADVVLTVVKGEKTYQVTTKKNDTLSSLPIRFAAVGCTVEPEEIIGQNGSVELFELGKKMFLPVEAEWKISLENRKYLAGCFALEVSLEITRNESSMHSQAVGTDAQSVRSDFPPLTENDSYGYFAEKVKEALPELWLCINGEEGGLWAIVMDEDHLGGMTVSPHKLKAGDDSVSMPMFYSLRPLALKFLSRSRVSVPKLNQDGTLSYTNMADFTEVDLDQWGDDFLEDMDWIARPKITERLLLLNPELYQTFYTVRTGLYQAVSEGLALCLKPVTALTDEEERLKEAKEQFALRTDHSLSDIASGDLVLQYDASSSGRESRDYYLDGSVCLPETADGNGSSREITVYGSRMQMQGKDASYYQHFFLNAGNQYRFSQFALDGLSWQTSQLETAVDEMDLVLKPVLPVLPDEITIDLASQVPAPLFLRRVPEAPVMLSARQEFGATYDEILSWTAEYVLRLPVRVQDRAVLTLLYNVNEEVNTVSEKAADLFDCLAAFRAVCEPLKELIEGDDDDKAENAFHSWITLAQDTADGWQSRWNDTDQKGKSGGSPGITFIQRLVWEEDTPFLMLTCSAEEDDAASKIGYPQISSGAVETELTDLTMTEKKGYARYDFPEDFDVDLEKAEGLFFRYRFPVHNILHVYNVKMEIQVKRNVDLPECDKKLSDFIEVNEAFIYTTPVCAQDVCSKPNTRLETAVDGGTWSEGDASPLAAFFEKLEDGNVLDCVVDYSFQNGSFRTKLPVAGFFHKTVQADTTMNEIETELVKWKSAVNPCSGEARWHFCLRVYDNADGGTSRLMADYKEIFFQISC